MSQKGLAPIILILLAAIGLILYLLISNTFSFKDRLFSLLYPKPTPHAQEVGESVPDEILLKFKPGVSAQAQDNVLKRYNIEIKETIPAIEVAVLKVPEQAKDRLIEALNKNPLVEYAEPNFIRQAILIPNDPLFSTAQWNLYKISAPTGWDISTGSSQAVIAILDSGIDLNHEDLKGKYLGSPTQDDYGHGTQVAGINALTNNGKGIAGVCWNCPILSLKVLNCKGSGGDSTVARGITAAADAGAKVINLSLGSYGDYQTIRNAVNYAWNKGLVVVAGAGNDGSASPFYPAAIDVVIAVGMTNGTDARDHNSNYGSWLDVMAPGVAIYTTIAAIIKDPSDPTNCTKYTFGPGGYGYSAGTSIAAPHVSGLAGLILSANPSLSNKQVVDIITSTADDLGPQGKDDEYGWGRINVYKALQKAVGITVTPDTTAPTTSITSPLGGSTISGTLDITADASDNIGVAKVEFYVDGVLHATDVTSPYLASWDTTSVSNGFHNLQTKAYDLAGNVGSSSLVNVTVDNTIPTPTPNPILPDTQPPTVSITSPTDGSIVVRNTTVNISADAQDNVKVAKVEFLINNSVKCTDIVTPYTCNWKVPGKRGVSYTLTVKAYDTSNNQSSAIIKVTSQ